MPVRAVLEGEGGLVALGGYLDDLMDDLEEDDFLGMVDEGLCWQCCGEGYCVVGIDIEPDFERGWYDGDEVRCPYCGGSGLAEHCTYW